MNKKLWVDDLRPIPDDTWDVARNFHQAICMLETAQYHTVSLDHDIASFYGNKELTGRDVLNWMIMQRVNGVMTWLVVTVHSANPVGRETMLEDIKRWFP